MAGSDTPKLSTCPVCGYTDTSADPDLLEEDIQVHMRSAHNLEPSAELLNSSVKPEGPGQGASGGQPAAAPIASVGTSPSGFMAPPNIGNESHGGAPGDPETQAGYPMDSDRR